MSVKFDLNDYKNKDGFYDYDSMVWDMEALTRVHKNCNKVHKDGEEILSIVLDFKDSKEYNELLKLKQQEEEEIQLAQIKYINKVAELQNKCDHYPAIYKGRKICLKCNKNLEIL